MAKLQGLVGVTANPNLVTKDLQVICARSSALYLPTSPYISLHLPISPYISLYLPISPNLQMTVRKLDGLVAANEQRAQASRSRSLTLTLSLTLTPTLPDPNPNPNP